VTVLRYNSGVDWRGEFEETQALLSGHFQLSSGLHSDRYLQCALLLQWPDRAERIGRALAELVRPYGAETVVAPALGGVIIGHEVARALSLRSVFTERREGQMQLRRGFAFDPGERVVVIEDVFTTGRSTRETLEAVTRAGAEVLSAGSIVDRGLPKNALPVPFHSLLAVEAPAWPHDRCPLCAEGYPLESPGSRHTSAAPGPEP
jgi:orotate phosphoribosyltransferase